MEREFQRAISSLSKIVEFVNAYAVDRIPVDHVPVVHLVIEEIFTNMVRHNATGSDGISIKLDIEGTDLLITLVDRDSPEFNISQHGEVDVDAPLQERRPGGLGIHLVRHLVDEIHYRYKAGVSVVKLTKKLRIHA